MSLARPWGSDLRQGALLPGTEAGAHGDRVLAVTLQSRGLVGQRSQLSGGGPADVGERTMGTQYLPLLHHDLEPGNASCRRRFLFQREQVAPHQAVGAE